MVFLGACMNLRNLSCAHAKWARCSSYRPRARLTILMWTTSSLVGKWNVFCYRLQHSKCASAVKRSPKGLRAAGEPPSCPDCLQTRGDGSVRGGQWLPPYLLRCLQQEQKRAERRVRGSGVDGWKLKGGWWRVHSLISWYTQHFHPQTRNFQLPSRETLRKRTQEHESLSDLKSRSVCL
jgi:hypothetical protein